MPHTNIPASTIPRYPLYFRSFYRNLPAIPQIEASWQSMGLYGNQRARLKPTSSGTPITFAMQTFVGFQLGLYFIETFLNFPSYAPTRRTTCDCYHCRALREALIIARSPAFLPLAKMILIAAASSRTC